jgi:D-arabinitol 4-dehydrogenase
MVEHPDIISDLSGTRKTIYGMLTAMLKLRHKHNPNDSVTLLSCDNVRGNGDHFQLGLEKFLEIQNEHKFLRWVMEHTKCPNSMVDRITPRPTDAIRKRIQFG